MVDEQREVESDEISRRMGDVIDDVEAIHSETVTPNWEVVEDEEGGKPTIHHLHDGERGEASIVDEGGAHWVARCGADGETLELGASAHARG